MRTREEHLAWCKERALEYLDAGDLANAITSMGSDLQKHPQTQPSPVLLRLAMMYYDQGDPAAIRRWIEGFR
jgi:Tfp pilus assembly protein PilF